MRPETMIYLKIGGTRITIPVNPPEISVSHPTIDKTAEVAGIGEVLIPQKPGLREVSWESFFPGESGDPYTVDFQTPRSLCRLIERAWRNRTKCRLIISRSVDYDTNMSCLITEFTPQDKGGEPNDVYYRITVREYRDYSVQALSVIEQTGDTVTASAQAERAMDAPEYIVGASVIINGTYYTDGTGLTDAGVANNVQTTITRIVSGNYAPYRVGQLGWVRKNQIQLVGAVSDD